MRLPGSFDRVFHVTSSRTKNPNPKTVQRTGASRFAPRQIQRHRRLAPVADLCVDMKSLAAILLFVTCLFARADLPYKLPPKAKYTASSEAIARAKTELSATLVTNAITLTNLFTS